MRPTRTVAVEPDATPPARHAARIRFIHNYFHPDVSSVSQLISDVAFHLAAEGNEVSVIASSNRYEASGRGSLSSRETVGGVAVRRVWASSLGKGSYLSRLSDQLFFCVGATSAALFAPRADTVVLLTNPPLFATLGLLLKRIRGERFIYVVMDLYPDVAVRSRLFAESSWLNRMLRKLTEVTLRGADRVVVLGDCMREEVLRYGTDAERIAVIRNWVDERTLQPARDKANPFRQRHGLQDKFVVMYSGNMGVAHRFDDLLEVALRLRERPDLVFVFVGGGARREEITRFREVNRLENLLLLPYQDQADLSHSLSAGDVHFVSLRAGFEGLVVPSKVYGTMAAGRPTIYQGAADGEVARMITAHGIGKVVEEENADALESAILRLYGDRALARRMGDRARTVLCDGYSREQAMKSYVALLCESAG
jgi:colanic acid biosynthesis glycosyl transferase WcaI